MTDYDTMRKEGWDCPRCKEKVYDFPPLSRRDNKTEICSQCGTDEALIDFANRGEQ